MSLFAELKRRNVLRVGAAYVVAAWLIIQVAETIFPLFGFGDTPARIVVIVLAIGFVPALVFAWAFEFTPEGLKREKDVDRSRPAATFSSKTLDRLIMVVLALALGYFAFDKFILSESREASIAEQARREGRSEALVETYGDKSIAVLAFEDMSPQGDQEYLSDGIAEELLHLLAKLPDLRVISRSSAFSYKGKDIKLGQVAEELNVANILEGSVRKSGDRVRITAQLIEAGSDTHLWSETYDRTLNDIFAVQDEIAATVAERLKVTLLGDTPAREVVNPAAYELLLEARHVRRSGTPEGFLRSNELAEEALQIEPDFAEPWVIKSGNFANMAESGVLDRVEAYTQAVEAADTALAINPDLAGSHSAKAWVAMTYLNDLVLAARHFERAIELDPTDPGVLSNAAGLLLKLRRFDQAIAIYDFVVQRSPLSAIAHFNLGESNFAARRFEEAAKAFRGAVKLSPDMRGARLWLAKALLLNGDAQGAYQAALEEPFEPFRRLALALCAAGAGHPEEADRALTWIVEKGEKKFPYDIASVWAYRQDPEHTTEWIRKAISYDDTDVGYPPMDPLFEFMLEDPGWKNLMKALGKSPAQLDSIKLDVVLPN